MQHVPDGRKPNPLPLSDDDLTVSAAPAPLQARALLIDRLRHGGLPGSLVPDAAVEASPAPRSIGPSGRPWVEADEPSGAARARVPARAAMTVLVVEGHAPTARALVRSAEAMGHQTIAVNDGAKAWSVLRHRRVSLVISDWRMPGLDGLELCRRLRAMKTDHYPYVMLLTDRGGDEDLLGGLRAGADDFLARPIDPRELAVRLEVARRMLARQEGLVRQNAELAELAATDPLTGLSNRRRFDEALRMHASLATRRGGPLSLVMLDVDHFKAYNDAFGHPAGDGVLRGIARLLRAGARAHDVLARFGGEEFVALLPATDTPAVLAFAERLRAAIEAADWPLCPVTASFGVATFTPATHATPDLSALVHQADEALYRSKRQGRNRVTLFEELSFAPGAMTRQGI